jgi:hypothetical protein
LRALFIAVAATVWMGCLSQSSLDGFQLPRDAREPGRTFAVRRQVNDKRNLDQLIGERLQRLGLELASNAEEADYVVSYVDRWYWDMRNYLIDLRIDVREARTNVLVATGRSYQTSLAAMGQRHESIIDRTLRILFEGSPVDAVKSASKKQARSDRNR